jgi:hypothetical protein
VRTVRDYVLEYGNNKSSLEHQSLKYKPSFFLNQSNHLYYIVVSLCGQN